MKRLSVVAALGALVVAGLMMTPASAAVSPVGTWYFRPDQTFTVSDPVVTHGFEYQTAVRPPINANGSSNWPAKRGVIPVQFDLLAAPTTTTTTTKTYDPPVWKSLESGWPYTFLQLCLKKDLHGAGFCPDAPATPALTFADIANLSATYGFTTGDCHTGSLRWDIYVQHGTNVEVVEVYYGNPNGDTPAGQSCSGSYSETGKNLMDVTDATLPVNRFEMLGGWATPPGPMYTTYADAYTSTNDGTDRVVAVQLTLDSGYAGNQIVDVSNVKVNDNTWVPKIAETSSSTVTGDFAKTCDLPNAEIRWAKDDGTPTGGINEDFSVQPKDTGQFFRHVDCKYIYNLDVSRLSGSGTYKVWANIGGENLDVPAMFDLK